MNVHANYPLCYSFSRHPDFYNKPIRLNYDDDPAQVIRTFFRAHSLAEIRERLWNMAEVCIATDNDYFETGNERGNLLYFYRQLEELVEASFVLKTTKKPK